MNCLCNLFSDDTLWIIILIILVLLLACNSSTGTNTASPTQSPARPSKGRKRKYSPSFRRLRSLSCPLYTSPSPRDS